jgi:hypothetical protein
MPTRALAPAAVPKTYAELRRAVETIRPETEVIVTTTKPDKYDRYLAVVFLLTPDTPEPLFLNNALLQNAHAIRMDPDAPFPLLS